MKTASPLTDKINMIVGMVVAIFSYVLGERWYLFLGFLLANVFDYVSRWIAARITGTESSQKGWIGVLKKLGYWMMIAVGFGMGAVFIELGNTIGVNLEITTFIGWYVLASLFFNEIRSILENLVDAGIEVPYVLTKGLEISNKAFDVATKGRDQPNQNKEKEEG